MMKKSNLKSSETISIHKLEKNDIGLENEEKKNNIKLFKIVHQLIEKSQIHQSLNVI